MRRVGPEQVQPRPRSSVGGAACSGPPYPRGTPGPRGTWCPPTSQPSCSVSTADGQRGFSNIRGLLGHFSPPREGPLTHPGGAGDPYLHHDGSEGAHSQRGAIANTRPPMPLPDARDTPGQVGLELGRGWLACCVAAAQPDVCTQAPGQMWRISKLSERPAMSTLPGPQAQHC